VPKLIIVFVARCRICGKPCSSDFRASEKTYTGNEIVLALVRSTGNLSDEQLQLQSKWVPQHGHKLVLCWRDGGITDMLSVEIIGVTTQLLMSSSLITLVCRLFQISNFLVVVHYLP
jgi:hypothetical protein